jgi:hypothetical protein
MKIILIDDDLFNALILFRKYREIRKMKELFSNQLNWEISKHGINSETANKTRKQLKQIDSAYYNTLQKIKNFNSEHNWNERGKTDVEIFVNNFEDLLLGLVVEIENKFINLIEMKDIIELMEFKKQQLKINE